MEKNKLYAAFGEFEIPIGFGDATSGWIPPTRRVRFKIDPLLGNVAMLKSGDKTLVLVSLDVLEIDTADATNYRKMVAEALGIGFNDVSVSVTHNHAGPAMTNCCDGPKDPALVEEIGRRFVETCLKLKDRLEPAVLGCGFTYENDISWNRRYVLRDGSVWAMPQLDKMDVLCAEGSIDPQVGVACVRDMKGLAMGYLVNFACHPLFYGGQCIASPNFPGELRKELKRIERPDCVTLFLNGAAGDISHGDPFAKTQLSCEDVGKQLAKRSYEVAMKVPYTSEVCLDSAGGSAELPKRHISDEHIARAERVLAGETDLVIEPLWHPVSTLPNKDYAAQLIALRKEAEVNPTIQISSQVMRIGDSVWAFTPGELFSRFGMKIKVGSDVRNTFVVGYSNGHIGYIFHEEAQRRGGYESTPCGGSKTDCRAGDIIVDNLCNLLKQLKK